MGAPLFDFNGKNSLQFLNGLIEPGLILLLDADHTGSGISLKGTAQFGQAFADGVERLFIRELVADGDHTVDPDLSRDLWNIEGCFFGKDAGRGFFERRKTVGRMFYAQWDLAIGFQPGI